MRDEETQFQPPTAPTVARRALALAAVVCRGFIDSGINDPAAEELLGRIRYWLEGVGLSDYLEPWESEIITATLAQLGQQRVSKATWAVEGLAVLAWALGCSEFPRHDQQVDPFAITGSVGFLADTADEFIATACLRSPGELDACRELMYAMHCRIRDFVHARDFSAWVEDEWLERLRLSREDLIVDGDLVIGGKPITAASPEDIAKCEWATGERHRASIWLIGEEYPSYWDWTVDT